MTVKTVTAESEVTKQASGEEQVRKREALERLGKPLRSTIWVYFCRTCYSPFRVCCKPLRYDSCKKTLQGQLAKNEMSITEVPPESGSLNGLHSRLQEIQVPYQPELGLFLE